MGNCYKVPGPEGSGDVEGMGQSPDPAPGTAQAEEGHRGSALLGWEKPIQRKFLTQILWDGHSE